MIVLDVLKSVGTRAGSDLFAQLQKATYRAAFDIQEAGSAAIDGKTRPSRSLGMRWTEAVRL